MDSQQPSIVQLDKSRQGSLAVATVVKQQQQQEQDDSRSQNSHTSLCDAYDQKYSNVLEKYQKTQEQLQYYKNESQSQTLLAAAVKAELEKALLEKDKAKQERIEVLHHYDSFLEEHEQKLKAFVQQKDKEVDDLQAKKKDQEETIKAQKLQLTGQDASIAEANKKVGVFERKIGHKEKTVKTLENETVFQNNQITKLKETIQKLEQEQESLHNTVTILQTQQKQKKWYHPIMFWRKFTSCGGARRQQNNDFPDIKINVEFVDVASITTIQ